MKILHLEDDPADASLVAELLAGEWPDCTITVVSNRPNFVAALEPGAFDLILSDFTLTSFTGLEALELAKQKVPDTPFVFFTGTLGEERAIGAMHDGAADYVLKDHVKRLVTAVRRSLRENQERHQRRQAERRIRELVEILDKAREAIVVTELDGSVSYWNRGAERLSGWSSAEAVGRRIDSLVGTEAAGKISAARQLLDTTGEWHGEFQLHDRQGSPFVVEISATLIMDDDGRPKARLSIATDITEKRKLEERLLRAQRLDSIGMLATGIAHDLNNVLAPIMMVAPILREHATDPTDLQMLVMLEQSAQRGAGLVRQILGFAHGVGGEEKLVQVKHLVRDLSVVINETFPKNIRYEERLAPALWLIRANPTHVHQLLLNLCVNARDAMPKGGTLTLRAENVLLDEAGARAIEGARPGAWLALHVEDTGIGIAPEVLAHIWDPFFTTKESDRGTGLGLSTVRGLVENHEGFIVLQTELDRGTAFRIYLPAAETAVAGESTGSLHPFVPRGNGELILIVDDEANVRAMTTATLARHGYRVLAAQDGTEALALFVPRSAEISIVITDLNMPKLDGATVVSVVHRFNPKVKLIVASGFSPEGRQTTATPPPFADALLSKPFTAEVLLATVNHVLHATTSPQPPETRG